MKRTILWEKWENNFAPNNDQEEDEESIGGNDNVPFIQTPYGGISFKMFAPEKNNMKFWCGHANFDLEKEVECKIIEDTPGVEIFNVFSSYRFRICVGLNFDDEKVKKNIAIRLGCIRLKIKNCNSFEIKKVKLDLESKGKPWTIYVLPNGKYEYKSYDDTGDFQLHFDKYDKVQMALGGKLLYGV